MPVTAMQAHVLANINRVIPLDRRHKSAQPRYQLDGKECTAQITALVVKKLISKHSGGSFCRLVRTEGYDKRVNERQPFSSGAIEALKASLSEPQSVRMIGVGRRKG